MPKFTIPASATSLREIDAALLDLRSDEEIIAQLEQFQPVTSEKNVWAFWDKGFSSIYPTHQVTVINWVRRLGPSWKVRVIDVVDGSPNNIYNFVDKEWFPDCFNNKTMDGLHAPQHAADLIRLPLVYLYGGAWMDVSNILHTHLDTLFWNHLTAPNTPYEMAVWIITGQIRTEWGSFGNYMFAARKNCEFVKYWHEGFKKLWEGRTNVDGFHDIPLMKDIGKAVAFEVFGEETTITMSDYVAQMLIGDRTRNLVDITTGWNGREFFNKKAFMVEGIRNGILGAILTNYDGFKQAELFLTPLDEQNPEKRKLAEDFVINVLENSHMYKVYHNSVSDQPALGDLVKRKEFLDVAHRPGTFGEMYRYGTVHWESTRKVERLEPQATKDDLIYATPTLAVCEVPTRN